ncbi:lambda-exonuclease family protein [Vibrio crassostreae]|uniref:lambda-exonuclease family protein n=1 Tax=Vibrio crassostreae TaxID=246167 RepID=UPI001B3017D4|nr:YqaJ viral recombinase family protein [Vibrio crassostreae]
MIVTAMKEVALEQGSDLWHYWRSQGVGGSDVPILMGLIAKFKKSPYKLWLEKTGQEKAKDISHLKHVKNGILLEPVARVCLANHFGVEITPVCIEDENCPWRKVSLDGVARIHGYHIPFEIKCPGENGFNDVLDKKENSENYQYYQYQVQYQIALTNAPFGYLCFYFEKCGNKHMKVFKIERDEAIISKIFEQVDKFWDCIEKMYSPDLSPEHDILDVEFGRDTPIEWIMDSVKLAEISAEVDKLEQRLKLLKIEAEQIDKRFEKASSGFKKYRVNNVVITRTSRTRTNYKKLAMDNLDPDLFETLVPQYRDFNKVSVKAKIVDPTQVDVDRGLIAMYETSEDICLGPVNIQSNQSQLH